MAFTPDQTNAIAAAYEAGNIGEVNNLLSAANMTAEQANSIWGSGISDLATQAGVQFANTPTGGEPTSGLSTLQNASNNVYGSSVEDLYKNVLGRAPDAGGLAYWKDTFGDTIDPTEISTFKNAAAPEITARGVLDTWATTNPKGTPNQLADLVQSGGGMNPMYASLISQKYGISPEDATTEYNRIIGEKTAAEKYQTDLTTQTDPMKTQIAGILQDGTVSQEEANAVTQFMNQTGFKPEDVSRVTGVPIATINDLIGRQGKYASEVITANPGNVLGVADYAIANGLNAKQMSAASNGAFTEEQAQSVLDKAGTYGGRLELSDPAAYNQIQGYIGRAVDKDYGGVESDWMYRMFGSLTADETSQAPKQLELTAPTKGTRVVGGDESGYQTEEYTIPGTIKDTSGLIVLESDQDGNPTKYGKAINSKDFNLKPGEQTHTGTQGLIAEYDGTGKFLGYSSGNRVYTSDPEWIGARWNPDGTSAAYGGYTSGGGFVKGLGNDVADFTAGLGPIWTVAKVIFPELNLVDVGADVARSEVGLSTGIKAAVGTGAVLDAGATEASAATNGLDGGNAISNASNLTNAANNARLVGGALSAYGAAQNENYTPLLALGANVAGINQMPGVATAMTTLAGANAFLNKDLAGALSAAGSLTNSPDLKLGSSAVRLLNASKLPDGPNKDAAIALAVMEFGTAASNNAKQGGAAKTVFDAINNSGGSTPKVNTADITGVDVTDLSKGVQVAGPGGLDQGGFKPGTPTQTASGMFFTTPDGTTYPVTVNKETGMMSTTDPAGVDEIKQFRINDTSNIKDIFFDKTTLDPNLSTAEKTALGKVTGKSSGDITDVEVKNASPEVQQQAQDLGDTLTQKIKSGAGMGEMLRMIGGLDTAENATALYIAKQLPELRDLINNAQNSGYVRELEEHLATDPTDANWLQEYKGITGKDFTLPSAGEIVITGSRIKDDGTTEDAGDVTDSFVNPYNGITSTTQVNAKTGAETVTEVDPRTKTTTQTVTTPDTITQIVVDPATSIQTKTVTNLKTNTTTKVKIDTKTGSVVVVPADKTIIGDTGGGKDKTVIGDTGGDKAVVVDPGDTTPTKTTTPATPTTPTKTTSGGGSAAPLSPSGTFLPPEPGKFKKISEEFTPLNPTLFALAGVGPLKGTLEESLKGQKDEKNPMPSLMDLMFAPSALPKTQTEEPKVQFDEAPAPEEEKEQIIPAYAQGGLTGMHPMGDPQFYSQGGLGNMHVQGDGDGTSDSVPAMVAKDEFVLPADVVSSLGNGSSEAGASVLDQFVEAIRQHKHSNPPSELPPQSKGPLEYLSSAMKKGHA